jgi:transposase
VAGIEHIGSAHTELELELLLVEARRQLSAGQLSLFDKPADEVYAESSYARFLIDTLANVYDTLGFDAIGDATFKQLVCARIIEPASKLDTVRILQNLGLDAPSKSTLHRSLARCIEGDYRSILASACFAAVAPKMLTLVLFDVTTLYFEVQKEDGYRVPGFSKERRLEPQITVGLLTDTTGFPLEVSSFEGNRGEVDTMMPILQDFRTRHGLEDICVVADAAMLSGRNLEALEALGYHYIVGNRLAKCPYEIEEYRNETGAELADRQIFESTAGFTISHRHVKRRVIYQYRSKRARLDLSNIERAVEKAKRMVAGKQGYKKNRFVKMTKSVKELNWDLIDSAKERVGIKGYVTDLDIDAQIIIDSYHRLFQIERSFRMSKSDLKARPIFHRKRDSIEAHLTVVFAALAMSRYIQDRTGLSIKKFIQRIEVLRDAVITVNGKRIVAPARIPADVMEMIEKLR